MLQAFAILLAFQLVGEIISYTLSMPVPGPVIGMILLFAWLAVDSRLLSLIQGTTSAILKHFSLLFVPAGVGIMVHAQRIGGEWFAIGTALIVSTVLAIVTTAWVTRALMRRRDRESPKGESPKEQS
jgi:holin-like protein